MRSEEDLRSCCDRAKEAGDYGAYLQAKSELVDFYRETFRFEEAFSAAEDVLMLMEELNLEETESFAAALMQAAVTYRKAGREQEALTAFTRALKICEAIWKPEDERFVGLDREIGLLLERLGEEERAEIFLQKALTLLENRPDATGKAAQVKTDLALLALRRKRPERAQTLLEEAIAGFRASGNQGDVRYSASLAGLGEALFSQGRLEKALEAYEQALSAIEKHFGKNESYAILCQNCAAICRRLGETDRAKRYEETALFLLREKD